MAWQRKPEEVPPPYDFKAHFGMDEQDVKKRIENSVPKEDFDALKNEQETTKSSLAALQEQLTSLTKPKPQVEETPDPTTELISDPKGFVDRQNQPTMAVAFQTRADLMEMKARQKYPELFKDYEKELTETAEKFNLQTRAGDHFWEMHVKNLIGDKALKGELRQGSYPSLMGAGNGTSSTGGDPDLGLSRDEIEYAEKRGIPKDKYARSVQLVKSGEKITMVNARKAGLVNG